MKTDELIKQLSQDLHPVKPVMGAGVLTALFSALSLLTVAAGLVVFHLRADVGLKMGNPFYWIDLSVPAILMVGGFLLVARMSVPGRTDLAGLAKIVVSVLSALVIFELIRSVGADMGDGLNPAGAKCSILVLLFAALPALALAFVAARRAPISLTKTGAFLVLAGVSAGELAITLHCPVDNALHIAVWHFVLPVSIGIALGTMVVSRFLRW